jgi:hypothetical protein
MMRDRPASPTRDAPARANTADPNSAPMATDRATTGSGFGKFDPAGRRQHVRSWKRQQRWDQCSRAAGKSGREPGSALIRRQSPLHCGDRGPIRGLFFSVLPAAFAFLHGSDVKIVSRYLPPR